MKVFNLACHLGHCFEGWFESNAERQRQLQLGLLTCPLCSSPKIVQRPSAPHVQIRREPLSAENEVAQIKLESESLGTRPLPTVLDQPSDTVVKDSQHAWVRAIEHVLAQTDDVGLAFAEEARRIHYGETPARGIRGQASIQQTQELLDEGIDIVPLLLPESLKGPLQ